jgi:MFS family permease
LRSTLDLLRHERVARLYYAVLAQSALGNGAGYIALLVVAYDRFQSAWAISLILLADLVPSMLLGPVFGAAADRWSRRRCLIVADVARAAAFLGIVLVDSFAATFALAMLAGAGTGLFTPAALAAIPSLVEPRRLPAATALYGAITDLGFIAGPGLAALILLAGGPETILVANAVTFAVSGVVLARLRFGKAPSPAGVEATQSGLLGEARQGLRALAGMAGVRAVVVASGAMLLFAGLFNVAELPFATDELDVGDAGFAALAGVYGLGFVVGSLSGARGGPQPVLKRRFLGGLGLVGAGFVACGFAPGFGSALGAFALAGGGNGLILVYERLLIQTTVPDHVMARVFGAKDGLTAWAFAIAFVAAGGLIEALGVRTVLVIAGVGGLLVWVVSSVALRGAWVETPALDAATEGRDGAVPSRQRQRSAEPERQPERHGLRRWS